MGRRRFTSIEEYNSEYALFAAIIGQLWRMSYPELQRLALNSDVTVSTLYNWRNGATLNFTALTSAPFTQSTICTHW